MKYSNHLGSMCQDGFKWKHGFNRYANSCDYLSIFRRQVERSPKVVVSSIRICPFLQQHRRHLPVTAGTCYVQLLGNEEGRINRMTTAIERVPKAREGPALPAWLHPRWTDWDLPLWPKDVSHQTSSCCVAASSWCEWRTCPPLRQREGRKAMSNLW